MSWHDKKVVFTHNAPLKPFLVILLNVPWLLGLEWFFLIREKKVLGWFSFIFQSKTVPTIFIYTLSLNSIYKT